MSTPGSTPPRRDETSGPIVLGPEGPRRSPLLRWFLILAAGIMVWLLIHVLLQSVAYWTGNQGASWLRHTNVVLLPLSLLAAWWALNRWVPSVSS